MNEVLTVLSDWMVTRDFRGLVWTQHHYGEIGLPKPASVGENNYYYYGREELLLLQQILFSYCDRCGGRRSGSEKSPPCPLMRLMPV